MHFNSFKDFFRKKLVIDSKDFSFLGKEQYIRRQISEWVKKERLLTLKRGIYVVNDPDVLEKISLPYIANYLYQPSYISMEYALRFYQFIPEEVYQLTSVTTRKTSRIKNSIGKFKYQHLKSSLYWGFVTIQENGWEVYIATREKALIDFFYFNRSRFSSNPEMIKSYRFQNIDNLNSKRLYQFLHQLGDQRLLQLINMLFE